MSKMASKEEYKEYSIKFKEFLKELPVQPSKVEFSKIKEQDQIKHTLKFDRQIATSKLTTKFNRYTNILPYDYNRIVLKEPVNECDYINGSYIHQPNSIIADFNAEELKLLDLSLYQNIQFLATQGPLPDTLEHHWQAIFDNNVDIILMLTKFVEGSKETNNEKIKCERYFPMKSDQCQFQNFNHYGKFEVMVVDEEEVRPNLTKSILYLIDTGSENIHSDRNITLLHYTGWPDFGAPEDTSDIIELVKTVRKIIKDEGKDKEEIYSILVHCSAGVGRTGTFIGLYKLMEEIEEKLEFSLDQDKPKKDKKKSGDPLTTLNIFETVMLLREKRCEMVQSYAQYKYLYACVADYLKDQNRMFALAQEYNSMCGGFDEL